MQQDETTCKSFEGEAWTVPPTLAELVGGRELVRGLDAVELREMSKFTELPNVWGLAAHPIYWPGVWCAGAGARAMTDGKVDSTQGAWCQEARGALGKLIGMFPLVCVRGWLGAGMGEAVQVFAPQNHARIAAGFAALMRPIGVGEQVAAERVRTLVVWPEGPRDKRGRVAIERFAGVWPEERLTILIGTDDLGAVVRSMGVDAGDRLRRADELGDAVERGAALSVGTMLFGVGVDAEGRIPALEVGGAQVSGVVVMVGLGRG